MVPIRYFVVLMLQFFGCVMLSTALLVGFAVNYSYLGGNHQDRDEMNATFAQLFEAAKSVRSDR